MGNLVKYGSYTLEDAEKDAEKSSAAGSGGKYWKAPAGESVVRFMPPRVGGQLFRVIHRHWLEKPGSTNKTVFVCPRMQSKEDKLNARRCPVCAKLDQMQERGLPRETTDKYRPQRKIFSNIISRGDSEKGVMVYEFPKQVHDLLISLRKSRKGGGDFCDPVKGFDLIIERSGTGIETKYNVFPVRDAEPLADDATTMNEWLESMHDLDAEARIPTEEELDALLQGTGLGRSEGERKPAAGKPAAAARGGVRAPKRTAADDAIEADYEEVEE